MKTSDRALSFAIRALDGQLRKTETDKPGIIHSMIVGDLLRYYGWGDEVVAAGYLHDVPEDAPQKQGFSIEDIGRLFPGKIAGLVDTVYNRKNGDWETRKRNKIKQSQNLPLENRAVLLADKLASLEEDRRYFQKTGTVDYAALNAGFEGQKWYNEELYKALAKNVEQFEDSPRYKEYLEMLERYYKNINAVFYGVTPEVSTEEFIYGGPDLNASKFAAQKEELLTLARLLGSHKPSIIALTAGSHSANMTLMDVIAKFFNTDEPNGLKITIKTEEVLARHYEATLAPDTKSLGLLERDFLVTSELEAGLLNELTGAQDIVLVDRGIFERLLLIQRLISSGKITQAELNESYLNAYKTELEALVNYVVIGYEEYEYKNVPSSLAVANCLGLLTGQGTTLVTGELTSVENPLPVLEKLLPAIRTEYIKELRRYINEKKVQAS